MPTSVQRQHNGILKAIAGGTKRGAPDLLSSAIDKRMGTVPQENACRHILLRTLVVSARAKDI